MSASTTASTAKSIYKVVRFDSSVDWKEEDCRTARGFDSRRERKESKKTAYRNLQARFGAVVEILYKPRLSTSLVTLALGNIRVHGLLDLFLDDFIEQNRDDIATRLGSFRNLQFNTISGRQTGVTDGVVSVLLAIAEFSNTFRAYLPATVLSFAEDDDSPRSRRSRTRSRTLRQGQENANKRLRRN